jgi:probable F420-dependent oxidoreductase
VDFVLEMSVAGDAGEPSSITTVVKAAEEAGLSAVAYTDHPAPSRKWLEHGGHATFDPFAALSFVAAVTSRLRIMTYLAVLPYRNPLLLSKSVATVDRLSSGRLTLVTGTGYLRSEFAALGRSFEQRNQQFEEAIDVLRRAYTAEGLHYEGSDFSALGVVCDPAPVQLPHPPIWIGGNSLISRRRVARYGAGWAPLRADEAFSKIVRTGRLVTDEELERAIEEVRSLVAAEGRDPMAMGVLTRGNISLEGPVGAAFEKISALEKIGVTHIAIEAEWRSAASVAEDLDRFGREVIAQIR